MMCATDLRVDCFPRVAFPAIIQPMLCFRAYSPPPVLNACVQRRRRISLVVQASRSVEDDYHATIKALNSRDRRVPRKSLGQHYLVNSSINERLSIIAGVEEGDLVLEIGPGTGSLTNVLINSGATVIAIEKDRHMAKIVEDRFGSTEKLMVLVEDITRCHVRSHVRSFLGKWNPGKVTKCAKVVSNIPFNISTDVVKLLLPMGDLFSDVVLLLQDETALRLVELQLRSPEYRPINLFVSFYSDAEYIVKVGRENFFPKPKVDAAVVKFKLKQNSEYPQVSSRKGFFSMVKSAFNGKRKMLRKSLQHICSAQEIEDALKTISLPVTARPQELSLEDFVRLYNIISKSCQIFPEPEHLNL